MKISRSSDPEFQRLNFDRRLYKLISKFVTKICHPFLYKILSSKYCRHNHQQLDCFFSIFDKSSIWIFPWGRQGWASILSPFQNKPLIRKPRLHINILNVLYTRNKPLKIMNIHEWIVLKSISRVKIQPNQNTVK